MNSTRVALALLVAVLALPLAAVGQDAGQSAEKKSLSDLRRETFQAEEEFYSVFNKLNDDRDFNVRCFYEKPTGSNIKNHVCRARFVTKAFSSHASRNKNDLSRVANQEANPVLAEKTAAFEKKMGMLVDANPELEAALIRYNTVRAEFMAEREANGN